MKNLEDILIDQAKANKLAHFYIVESNTDEENAFHSLINFTHSFIKKYYTSIEHSNHPLTNLMDHPDVFVLGQTTLDEDEKVSAFLSVEEAAGLNRFFEFKAVQSKRKFAIITQGHRINQTVANKWLKLLEEPVGEATIFLLNPRGQRLLETIHSRAQHLRLAASKSEITLDSWFEFLRETKKQSLSEFLEANTKSQDTITNRTQQLISWESEQKSALPQKDALFSWLKNLQEYETFHQPSATKWTLFYRYLQVNVLPRI